MSRRSGNTRMECVKNLKKEGWHTQKSNPKHRYVYILDKSDKALYNRIESMKRPYPKRAESIENDAHNIPVVTGRCDSDLGAPLKDNA